MKTTTVLERDSFLREIVITLNEEGLGPKAALALALKLPVNDLIDFGMESREVYCLLLRRTVRSFKNAYKNIEHTYPYEFDEFILSHYGLTESA